MITSKLKSLPSNQPYILENITCVYCGYEFVQQEWTKEHVVGRKFVPKGRFNGRWNLIVRACEKCNGYKSELENDISAITMQPDAFGKYAINDKGLVKEAKRKAKNSISRKTRKPVKSSAENINISVPFLSGITMDFNMTCPPQMEGKRMFELARLQLMGFFYMLTYNKDERKGYYWRGEYSPLLEAIRDDWGNPVHNWFIGLVKDWEPRLMFVGADGFFKASIRRSPTGELWSWALEWNHNYRLIGFFGDSKMTKEISKEMPSLNIKHVTNLHNSDIRARINTPLEVENDFMFEWSDKSI